MIAIKFSPSLHELTSRLDDSWEADLVEQLPFPIAYHLKQLRDEGYPWDFLVKDMLHILLKYLAVVGVSDYLHSRNEPDYDINEQLQNLRLNMSEGHWLRLLRSCATSKTPVVAGELREIFRESEKGSYTASLSWPETNIQTDPAGILSTLVTIRNKLHGHGKSPSEQDKTILKPQVLGLVHTVLFLFRPLWSYDLVYVFEGKRASGAYILRGTTGFRQADLPAGSFPSKCFLHSENQFISLSPLVISDQPKLSSQVTLVDLSSEQYILEHIDSRLKPEYIGVSGASYKPAGQESELNRILERKNVWAKRKDVELDDLFRKLQEKTVDSLEDIESNNIFKTRSYFHRQGVEDCFRTFIDDNASRALIVSGVSGCGKTTAVMRFVGSLIRENKPVLLVRAVELPERVQRPKEFDKWITGYLGFNGTFSEVLDYLQSKGREKLTIIIDGLNEFTALGRDASKVLNSLNHFLADHQRSEALKLMITIRSDTLNFFMPGGKLPADAIEELFFRPNGKDFYEIGTLSMDEGLELLGILKMDPDKARQVMDSLKVNLRTPQALYKIASGAITPGDLKGMDSLKITSRFLEKRLGRDKKLKKLCMELVGVMGKAKDLNITEGQLAAKAPKLLARLKENNHAMLHVLTDLEIIQQIKTEDASGNNTTTILLSHDTIFEAMVKNVDKMISVRKYGPLVLMIVILLFFMVQRSQQNDDNNERKIASIDAKLDLAIFKFDSIFQQKKTSGYFTGKTEEETESIRATYHTIFSIYRSSAQSYSKMETTARSYGLLLFSLLLGLIFFAQAFIGYLTEKIDKREFRIKFFGKDAKLKQFKMQQRLALILLIPYMLIIIGLQFSGLEEQRVVQLTMLTIFLFIPLSATITPMMISYKTISMCKDSPLITEYFLSKRGRYIIRFEQLLYLVAGFISLALIVIVFNFPESVLYPKTDIEELRAGIRKELAPLNIKTIEQDSTLSSLPLHSFVSSNGLSMEKEYSRSMYQRFKQTLVRETGMNMENSMIGTLLILVMISITLVTSLVNIIPYEFVARKYYGNIG